MDFEINENLTIEKKKFFVTEELRSVLHTVPLKARFAGEYLGKKGKKRVTPSTSTLAKESKNAHTKIILNSKGAWLFICSRNLWKESIEQIIGKPKESEEVFIFNEFDECLGYGRYKKGKITVETLFDIGDFLRRERKGRD